MDYIYKYMVSNETQKRVRNYETVNIERPVKSRLVAYANSQRPRVLIADVVTIAVEDYLDKQEKPVEAITGGPHRNEKKTARKVKTPPLAAS